MLLCVYACLNYERGSRSEKLYFVLMKTAKCFLICLCDSFINFCFQNLQIPVVDLKFSLGTLLHHKMPFHSSVHHRSGGWNSSSHLFLFTHLSELPWAMGLLILGDEISSFSLKQERRCGVKCSG